MLFFFPLQFLRVRVGTMTYQVFFGVSFPIVGTRKNQGKKLQSASHMSHLITLSGPLPLWGLSGLWWSPPF